MILPIILALDFLYIIGVVVLHEGLLKLKEQNDVK